MKCKELEESVKDFAVGHPIQIIYSNEEGSNLYFFQSTQKDSDSAGEKIYLIVKNNPVRSSTMKISAEKIFSVKRLYAEE